MLRRRILINLAVFLMVAAYFTYWAATNIISFEFIDRPFAVTADFEDAMGVLPNAEVTYLGTQVGLVQSVDRRPGGVRVTMKIDRGREIPAGSSAHIWRKSALGEQYVDFSPPEGYQGGGALLTGGDHIPADRTTIPIEFADMLRAADELLGSIDRDDLRVITEELATGLVGRTDDLRALIVEGARFSEALASRTDALDRLATNNTRLTRVLADHSGSLERSLGSLRQVMESLDTVKAEFGPLVEEGADLLGELVPVVRDGRSALVCLLDTLGQVVEIATTDERLEGLERLLVDFPVAVTDQLTQAVDIEVGPDGRVHQWVRVDVVDEAGDPDIEPDRPTPPPVADVPECDVSFASTSEVGAPGPESPRVSGPTPATGGPLPATAAAGAVILALAAWRTRGPRVP